MLYCFAIHPVSPTQCLRIRYPTKRSSLKTIHRIVFLTLRPSQASNPLYLYQLKKKQPYQRYGYFFWRRARDPHFVRTFVCFADLRDYMSLLLRLRRTAKDGLCSNPLQSKTPNTRWGIQRFNGGEQGIRTLEAVLAAYTISNRAPSTSSDNSPDALILYIKYK